MATDCDLDSSSGCDLSFECNGNVSPLLRDSSSNVEVVHRNESNMQSRSQFTPLHGGVTTTGSFSPPYKRVRALRLFDSPLTPKTILQKSGAAGSTTILPSRSRLFIDKPRPVASAYAVQGINSRPAANVNPFTPNGMLLTKKRTRSIRRSSGTPHKTVETDINAEEADDVVEQPTKRVALQESNISRYHQEFHEVALIGSGQFGSVFKCINRLDGCVYAIKRSSKPVAGSASEKAALNEVYAHAVLGKHQHVVRYYSAWAEDNHMIIQNEYCNGGSLADRLLGGKTSMCDRELRVLLQHVAEGLRYIHAEGLVHLDIKPANIFISIDRKYVSNLNRNGTIKMPCQTASTKHNRHRCNCTAGRWSWRRGRDNKCDSADDGFVDLDGKGSDMLTSIDCGRDVRVENEVDDDCDENEDEDDEDDDDDDIEGGNDDENEIPQFVEQLTYKIGDLGHVTSLSNPQVEEGDCRYLPFEILQEDYRHLSKADIFALGLTVVECAGFGPLPKNGPMWHRLRSGNAAGGCIVAASTRSGTENIQPHVVLADDLAALIGQMVEPDPNCRPAANYIVQHLGGADATGTEEIKTPIVPAPVCATTTSTPLSGGSSNKTRAQLHRELNAEKLKNEILSRQLQEAAICIKSIGSGAAAVEGATTKSPLVVANLMHLVQQQHQQQRLLIGKKVNRSVSTTTF